MTHAPWNHYTPSSDALKGRTIAITGVTSGIGYALAQDFARHQANVVLLGRDIAKLEALYDELISQGGTPAIAPLDLEKAQEADYQQLQESIAETFDSLDGLIHCGATLGERTSIQSYRLASWQQVMHINVTAAFALTKYLLPLFHNQGAIVFTSSSVAQKGRAYWGAYAASKAAIENLTETLADELEDISHIRVNSVNPGATHTPMRTQAFPAEDPSRLKTPDALVPMYRYLMLDDSQDIRGQHLSFASK